MLHLQARLVRHLLTAGFWAVLMPNSRSICVSVE